MSRSPFHSLPDVMCFEFDDDEPVPFYDACQVLPSGDQDDDYEKTFTTLEARRSSPLLGDPSMTPPNVDVKPDGVGPLDSFLSGDDVDTLLSWSLKLPEQWDHGEVLDWVYHFAVQRNITGIVGHAFNRYNGEALCRLSQEDFRQLDPTYGDRLHDWLQEIRMRQDGFGDVGRLHRACPTVIIDGDTYDFDVRSDMGRYEEVAKHNGVKNEFADPLRPSAPNVTCDDPADVKFTPPTSKSRATRKKKGEQKTAGKRQRGRKRGQTSKGNHLWEFVVEMLSRHDTAAVVCWENMTTGIFRFVDSRAMARLWGERKKNQTMTYEKLSRAMRFCRGRGYFAKVPRSENYAKKLVFQFGPKAEDWQRATRTSS